MFLLPYKSERKYRGKYPGKIHSWSYGRSSSTKAVGAYLGIRAPVWLELNDGRRYIADRSELISLQTGLSLESCVHSLPINLIELSELEYGQMLMLVRRVRAQGLKQ